VQIQEAIDWGIIRHMNGVVKKG